MHERAAEVPPSSDIPHRHPITAILPSGHRIASLDGVRGLAILMVMLFHFHLAPIGGTAGWAFGRIAGMGANGVTLFFVLSGFLITGILWDSKGDENCLKTFFARRVLRIFPLYYGALFVGLILLPLLHPVSDPKYLSTVHHQIWLWTYTSNVYESWSGRAMPLFGHFWSLAVEEHFYLVWPFVVLRLDRRALMRACAGCFIVAFLTRLTLLESGADPYLAVWRLTPCQLDPLAAGAFAALALRMRADESSTFWRGAALRAFVASGAVLATLMLLYPEFIGGNLLSALFNSVCSIFFSSGIFLLISETSPHFARAFFEWGWLRTIGKYSYGLYVFHWPLGRLCLALMEKWGATHHAPIWFDRPWLFQGVYLVMASASSLLAAFLSWHLYERHFLRLKAYFQTRREMAAFVPKPP